MWFWLTALAETLVIGLVPLGPAFDLLIFVIAPIGALMTVAIAELTVLRTIRSKSSTTQGNWSWRWYAALIAITILGAVVIFTPNVMERQKRHDDAQAALTHFDVRYGYAIDKDIEAQRVERTLAEFGRQRNRLIQRWPTLTHGSPITLYLFKDLQRYRTEFGLARSHGAMYCAQSGPVIGVPLEQASNILNEEHPSQTPMHEITHSLMCSTLGPSKFIAIPAWFHEGIAQLHQTDSFRELYDRAFNRVLVRIKRRDLMHPGRFCSYDTTGSIHEVALFYGTSLEIVRWLEHKHGRNALHNVIKHTQAGLSFEQYVHQEFGASCTELYGEWLSSFGLQRT